MAAPTPDSFKPALSFDVLTGLFDPVVAVASREGTFKRRTLDRAEIAPGEAVLDLGCGTGTLALLAWNGEPGATFTGLDADPAILERARAKASDRAAPIDFDCGMSVELPYPDSHFDVVLATLFFHHLDDAAKGTTAAEIVRVLRPAGRVVVADYGRAQDPLMRVVFAATIQVLDGRATTALNAAGGLSEVLVGAGLADVTTTDRLRTPTGSIEILAGQRP